MQPQRNRQTKRHCMFWFSVPFLRFNLEHKFDTRDFERNFDSSYSSDATHYCCVVEANTFLTKFNWNVQTYFSQTDFSVVFSINSSSTQTHTYINTLNSCSDTHSCQSAYRLLVLQLHCLADRMLLINKIRSTFCTNFWKKTFVLSSKRQTFFVHTKLSNFSMFVDIQKVVNWMCMIHSFVISLF